MAKTGRHRNAIEKAATPVVEPIRPQNVRADFLAVIEKRLYEYYPDEKPDWHTKRTQAIVTSLLALAASEECDREVLDHLWLWGLDATNRPKDVSADGSLRVFRRVLKEFMG